MESSDDPGKQWWSWSDFFQELANNDDPDQTAASGAV